MMQVGVEDRCRCARRCVGMCNVYSCLIMLIFSWICLEVDARSSEEARCR